MDPTRIKDLRKSMGLTQGEVAKAIDVDKQTIVRWETGKTRMAFKYQKLFTHLLLDDERIALIKSYRPKVIRGRPFQKRGMQDA